MTMNDYFADAARCYAKRLDDRVRMCIKPKPRWLTKRMWYWIMDKFLVMEYFSPMSKGHNNAD